MTQLIFPKVCSYRKTKRVICEYWLGIAVYDLHHGLGRPPQPRKHPRVSVRPVKVWSQISIPHWLRDIPTILWLGTTCCHDKPGTLQPTCFSLQPGQSLSCSYRESNRLVFHIGRLYQQGQTPTRGCHPFHPTRGASWCQSIIGTKNLTHNWYASIRHFCPLVLRVLAWRLESKAVLFLGRDQYGFRRGLGTRRNSSNACVVRKKFDSNRSMSVMWIMKRLLIEWTRLSWWRYYVTLEFIWETGG